MTASQLLADLEIVRFLTENWPKRAGVRRNEYYDQAGTLDRQLSDYPLNMVPFACHPKFERASDDIKQQVLTSAWLVYNQRVIEIEHLVTNPAINMLLYGTIPGAEVFEVKSALRQTMIDEQFHLMMHEAALHETVRLRGIALPIDAPQSLVYRKLRERQGGVDEQWQKNLLNLLWAVVSEMTINAYLSLLANADGIQPMHRQINWLHNRDELAHNKIFVEVSRFVFHGLNAAQKDFFIESLPKTIEAFTSHDFSSWAAILERVDLPGREEIVGDCKAEASNGRNKLMSDVSGIRRLLSELQIAPEQHAVLSPLLGS